LSGAVWFSNPIKASFVSVSIDYAAGKPCKRFVSLLDPRTDAVSFQRRLAKKHSPTVRQIRDPNPTCFDKTVTCKTLFDLFAKDSKLSIVFRGHELFVKICGIDVLT